MLCLKLTALSICLLSTSMQCIKIGISQSYNTSTTPTTTTTTTTTITSTTTETPTTTIVADTITTDISPVPDAGSTPSQTFPPRKTPKPRTTTAPRRSSSTPAPTTETLPLNTTTAPFHGHNRFAYCACDLHSDLCDINCCCDPDCPQETLQVFSCLPEQPTRLEDFQYNHGLPPCQLSDGWLCVFRSNTKPAKIQTPINNFDAAQYNKWPEQLSGYDTQLPSTPFAAHYKFGQALQLWQPESKELSSLELPMGYESASCQLKQTLLYLQPMRSSCLLSDASQMQTHLWTLLNVTSNHQLLSRPCEPEEQEEVPGISIQVCQQLLLQTQVLCLAGNETQVDMLVDSIELELTHNYTHILEAKLLLREAREEEEHQELWLSYALVYKSVNDNKRKKPSSGPLGYVLGAPILLGMMLQMDPKNETEQSQHLLSYFQSNASERNQHWLTPCRRHSLEPHHAVSFGIDLASQCQLRQLAPEHDNHTDYCQQLQSHIWQQLLPQNCTRLDELGKVFVSQLGRPQPDKWLPIQLGSADGQQLPPVQGIYDEQQQSLSCRNMLLSVSYEFYMTELTLLGGHVPHQNVLQHARLVLGHRHDLEFDARDQQVELPLAVTVMFFKAQHKRLTGSSLRIVANFGLIFTTILVSMRTNASLQLF